jgi:hypothetical protein
MGVLAALTLSPNVAAAQVAACEALPADQEAIKQRDEPLALPADWRAFAHSSVDWLAIATKAGTTHCVAIAWYDEAAEFERFGDRFAGFAWSGLEAWGYVLVDREWTGSELDTGTRPAFSPGGRRIAAVQWSDSGWGGFEGFGVWDIHVRDLRPAHIDTALPGLQDWRIDGWEDEDCLHLSAVPYERIEGDWERLATAERDRYVAGAPTGWRLTPGETCPVYGGG